MCIASDPYLLREIQDRKTPITCYSARFIHSDGTMRSLYKYFKFKNEMNVAEDATGVSNEDQIGFHLCLKKQTMISFVRAKARQFHNNAVSVRTHIVLCEYEIDPKDVVNAGNTDTGEHYLGQTILVRKLMGKGKIVLQIDLKTGEETQP